MNKINRPTNYSFAACNSANAWQSTSSQVPLAAALPSLQESGGFSRFTRLYQKLAALPRAFRRRLVRKARLTLADIAFILALGFALPAAAQNILVNTNIPAVVANGSCSLVEAIDNANADAQVHSDCPAGSGADTLTLQSASIHVITGPVVGSTNQGLPTIASQIVIQGNGATLKVAAVPVDTVISVASTGRLTLSDAIITGDEGSGSGTYLPRVLNAGVMQLSNVKVLLNNERISAITSSGVLSADRIEVNTVTGVADINNHNGHGLRNTGNASLSNSQVKNLNDYYFGAGEPLVNQGSMNLLNVSISGNTGFGGRYFTAGIDNMGVLKGSGVSVVSNPGGYAAGSGVMNRDGATLTLRDSVITGNGVPSNRNSGFGGLMNAGRTYLERVAIDGNSEGIANSGFLKFVDGTLSDNGPDFTVISNSGDMSFAGVTVSNNKSTYGPVITNSGTLSISKSTITSNSTSFTSYGYGSDCISNVGALSLNSATVTANFSSSGLGRLVNSGLLSLSHSLVIGASQNGAVIANVGNGHVLANDYNLFGDSSLTKAQALSGFAPGSSDVLATSDGNHPASRADIMAAGLADNGGLTPTLALAAGSPALDAVGSPCVSGDQRGIARPQGAACDIGAYEWAGVLGPTADLSISMVATPDPLVKRDGNYLTYTIVVANNSGNTAQAVSVNDALHVHRMTFISAAATQGACTPLAGNVLCSLGDLAAKASATVTITVEPTVRGAIPNAATVSANGADPNHANNVASVASTVLVNRADLSQQFVSNPPAQALFGSGISVTDTVQNRGAFRAPVSQTRYYLSLDKVKNAGDLLLGGGRFVQSLARGASASGGTTVTISNANIGNYYLLACADDTKIIAERSERNNCRASWTTMLVKGVDLLETALSNPPATIKQGGSFAMTDTAMNQGNVASGAAKTRYYLSLDKIRGAGDRLLVGSRSVSLAAYASSTGTITVNVPAATPTNTYYVLGCADDANAMSEVNEKNNCLVAASSVIVH